MDPLETNLYSHDSGFVNLLTSQQSNHPLETNLYDDDQNLSQDKPKEQRSRRKWSHIEDVVLISSWLNTSKDSIIGNEQKDNAFWSRIAAYYAASPKLAGVEKREPMHCKQRWQKINDQVCKFVGSYEAATKEKSSGHNEDDVIKLAYQIFFNDYKLKFTLEHAWRELRHDQKWCCSSYTKDHRQSKRRKSDEQSTQSSSSVPLNHEEVQARPPGVRASKAKGKRPASKATSVKEEGKDLEEFKSMWEIKEKNYERKEKQSKLTMLEKLIGKTEPLTDMEMAIKNKLMNDFLSNE
ncbi:Glutathione S-transferase T3 [Cardamine amara subsp. amara]|uniref:Glutathione S-transferase T3 n=1 Tax=Cardamine amara subsp. amara TaxID=228776 RepID=A0ABD1C9N2_CARAN